MTSIGPQPGTVNTTRVGDAVFALRAAVYLRVSTGRQAEQELSIPDQKAQIRAWCALRGWSVVAEYVEPGATATDDKRPEFQRMIDRACDGENAFDVIVVHSFSRFFREAFGLEFYVRKLAKPGVRLVSITQELGDDPAQVMMRQVIALFDEYQSKENAKHVIRTMKENARQGFWNGSRPPLGYKTIEAEQRGQRVKKKLAIDVVEAEQVRLMFRLFLEGDNGSGPMGIKTMVSWLNERGYRTRGGASWGVGQMYALLTNPAYSGRLRYNWVEHRTGRRKPDSEIIYSDVPAIIEQETFDRVQASLKARNPRVTPPRIITGPILLTGLAVCASCGGGMTLRTGTSHRGDVYKYYTCSTHARQGKTRCRGRSIRMDKLDTLVTRHLSERLFQPERLTELLSALASRRADKAAAAERRTAALEREANDADARLRRLYRLVEDGIADLDEALKDRIAALRAARDGATAALNRAKSGARQTARLSPVLIEQFGHLMRENLSTGEVPFRKAYLASIVDRVEVDDREVRILGRKDVLEQCVMASGGPQGQVRRSVRGWLGDEDSNLD
jgi:site-specific DNA recombinase